VGGKLNVYNLGELGVNVTKSPLHHADGEMLSCQNAEFNAESGVGGIRKRAGLQRLNSTGLGASIKGVVGVPLPGPGRRSVYRQKAGVPWMRVTTDGTTWADTVEEFNKSPGSDGFTNSTQPMNLSRNLYGNFYYPGEDGLGNCMLRGFDGIAEYEVLRVAGESIRVLGTHGGSLIFSTKTINSQVYLLDPITGVSSKIGDDIIHPEEPMCACSYLGRVWLGTGKVASPGKIYSARVGAATWTLERTAAANLNYYKSLCVFGGKLYAGLWGIAGTFGLVEERTITGVWSTVRTGNSAPNYNGFDGLAVCNGALYAAYQDDNGAVCRIDKMTSAGVWSIDKDLVPDLNLYVIGVVVAGLTIFYQCSNGPDYRVYRKAPSGAFTLVDSEVGGATFGVMGVI
jgi:hypothetical protein